MVDHHSHPWRDFRRVHGVAATAVPRVNPFPLCWRRGSAVGYTTPLAERMKKIRQAYNVMSLSPGEKQHKCTLRVANTCERKVSKNHAMFVMPFWIFVAPEKMLSTRSAHYTTWYGFFFTHQNVLGHRQDECMQTESVFNRLCGQWPQMKIHFFLISQFIVASIFISWSLPVCARMSLETQTMHQKIKKRGSLF